MFIKDITNENIVLRETSYGLLFRSIIIFLASLIITINAKNTESTSVTSLFITGPLLMATSFLFAVLFFKKITIIIGTDEISRSIWKMNKVKEESLSLTGLVSIEIVPKDNSIFNFLNKTRYNIFLKFENETMIQLNANGIGNKRAIKICEALCNLLLVPYNKTEKESIVKAISSIRKIIK